MEKLNEKTIKEILEARKRIGRGEFYSEDEAREIGGFGGKDNDGKMWSKAIKLLNSECPTKCCEWCDGR